MDIVAQILSERPGEPERKEFEIADLDDALSASSTERKHVTLYPGDYAAEWGGGTQLEIPVNVTVTLMPGAIVDYATDFRTQEYDYDGAVIEAKDNQGNLVHPLATGAASRYDAPNFSGHVENISDLNLASEWAFKQEFERSLWALRDAQTTTLFDVPFDGTVEVRQGKKMNITTGPIPGADEGPFVDIAHADVPTTGSPINTGTSEVVQDLSLEDGHVVDVQTLEVVEQVTNTDGYISLSGNRGEIVIGHSSNGVEYDTNIEAQSIRDFETDDQGHVENVTFGPNVEEVVGGRAITVTDLAPGDPGSYEVSVDPADLSSNDGNVEITDSGSTIDFSLNDATSRQSLSSDPADPAQGESVVWLSDGTGSGDAGDVMIKVNVGGTVKTATLFDYSAA